MALRITPTEASTSTATRLKPRALMLCSHVVSRTDEPDDMPLTLIALAWWRRSIHPAPETLRGQLTTLVSTGTSPRWARCEAFRRTFDNPISTSHTVPHRTPTLPGCLALRRGVECPGHLRVRVFSELRLEGVPRSSALPLPNSPKRPRLISASCEFMSKLACRALSEPFPGKNLEHHLIRWRLPLRMYVPLR